MTTKELKSVFQNSLSEIYSLSEINLLYSIFIEKYLGYSSFQLKQRGNIEVDQNNEKKLLSCLEELKSGKPYQQILGEAEFFGMTFQVNEHVLIPRPETEELLELCIAEIKQKFSEAHSFSIVDIGTGSGIIPIILKKNFPHAEVVSMDISAEALEIARKNAEQHHCDIHFMQEDYLHYAFEKNYDIIISNPPYIGLDENPEIEESVKSFEPNIALFSPTNDPLIFYRKIACDAKNHLSKKGMIFLEINQKLGPETLELFEKDFKNTQLIKDISGNDRMIKVSC